MAKSDRRRWLFNNGTHRWQAVATDDEASKMARFACDCSGRRVMGGVLSERGLEAFVQALPTNQLVRMASG